jgi:hypothetical protein
VIFDSRWLCSSLKKEKKSTSGKMSIILSRYSRLKFITIRLEAVSPSEAVL